MFTSTKKYAVAAGITAFIAIYAAGSSPALAADTPVKVTNTTANPVPTTVTNSAANPVQTVITNSPANLINTKVWNTLNVKVGNTAAAPVIAQVTNTTANPVGVQVSNTKLPVSDVNKPAHVPFSKRLDIVFSSGFGSQTIAVPAGKRLVIKYISADGGVTPGAHILFDVAVVNQGEEVEAHLPMISQGQILGQEVYSMSEQTLMFADAGSNVTIACLDSDSTKGGGLIVGVFGYLIDASAPSYE